MGRPTKEQASFAEMRVSAAELSVALNIAISTVHALAQKAVLPASSGAGFPLVDAIRRYLEYKLKGGSSLLGNGSDDDGESNAKARLEGARADMAEMERDAMAGKLHNAEDVERSINGMLGDFRARILGLPTTCAAKCANKEAPAIEVVLRKHVHEALNELVNYDPARFAARATA